MKRIFVISISLVMILSLLASCKDGMTQDVETEDISDTVETTAPPQETEHEIPTENMPVSQRYRADGLSVGDRYECEFFGAPNRVLSYDTPNYVELTPENSDILAMGYGLPLYKLDNREELDSFLYDYYTLELEGYAADLDDGFFENNVIIAVFKSSPIGGYGYYISNVKNEGGNFTVYISHLLEPIDTMHTDANSKSYALMKVSRAELEGVMEYNAYQSTDHVMLIEESSRNGMTLDLVSNEYFLTCYYDTFDYTFYGKFELTETELIFLPNDEHNNKFAFDVIGENCAYNAEKSEVSFEVPFSDGTVFKASEYRIA